MRIDHPQAPADRFLLHSLVGSSEMLNLYSGRVVLDVRGNATIRLPRYFQALNGSYRYQLTPIGSAAPNLHVSREVADNRFAIDGGNPGQTISWQVTGVRRDAYARAHPIKDDSLKPTSQRGRYANPELYGRPEAEGLGPQRAPSVSRDDVRPMRKSLPADLRK